MRDHRRDLARIYERDEGDYLRTRETGTARRFKGRLMACFGAAALVLALPSLASANIPPGLENIIVFGLSAGLVAGVVVWVILVKKLRAKGAFSRPVLVLICLAALPMALLLGILVPLLLGLVVGIAIDGVFFAIDFVGIAFSWP